MAPAKIIILRHGEKKNGFELCSTGVQRSLALTTKYLGKGGQNSLFDGGGPDAIFVTSAISPTPPIAGVGKMASPFVSL